MVSCSQEYCSSQQSLTFIHHGRSFGSINTFRDPRLKYCNSHGVRSKRFRGRMDYIELLSQCKKKITSQIGLTTPALQTITERPPSTNSVSKACRFCFKQCLTFLQGTRNKWFLDGYNILSSASVNLAGHNIETPLEKTFAVSTDLLSRFLWCKMGYLCGSTATYADLLEADYWVLIIAVCTYLILANHEH